MNIRIFPLPLRKQVIEAEVRRVIQEYLPGDGVPPSDEQVRSVLAAFMADNPIPPGKDGRDGEDGHSVTEEEYTEALQALWDANPPKDGVDGQSATQDQVNQSVAARIGASVASWLTANPVLPGVSVKVGAVTSLPAGQAPKVENTGTEKDLVLAFSLPAGADGGKGNTGSPGDSRVKYAKTGLQTNASGVYTAALGGPGTFAGVPVVLIEPKGSNPRMTHSYSLSGNAAAGFTITVTFTQIRDSVTVAVLGLVQLTVAITAPVTFDLIAMEQT